MLTRSSWVKIIIVALLCALVCTGALSCSFGCTPLVRGCSATDIPVNIGGADYQNVGSGTVKAQDVKNINIAWLAGTLQFDVIDDGEKAHAADAEHAAQQAEIRFEDLNENNADDRAKLRWEMQGDTLKIASCSVRGGLVGCSAQQWQDKKAVIHIPKSVCEQLNRISLEGASGNYQLDGISCKELHLEIASGNLNGAELACDALQLELASGKVELGARIAHSLSTEMASGHVLLSCLEKLPSTMAFEMASGNAELIVPQGAAFSANAEKATGSFSCDVPDCHRVDDTYVCGDASSPEASQISVKMTSGNVKIREA